MYKSMFQKSSGTYFKIRGIFCMIAILVCSWTVHASTGIFIYRESSAHPVSSAIVQEYKSYKKWRTLTEFRTRKYGIVKITEFQPLQILPYVNPQPAGAVIRASSLSYWRATYLSYKTVHSTYPASRVFLGKRVTQLKRVVDELSLGKAWFEGKWLNDLTVEKMIKERKLADSKSTNRKKNKIHNEKIESQIEEKKKALSSLVGELHELKNQIKSKELALGWLSNKAKQIDVKTRNFLQQLGE